MTEDALGELPGSLLVLLVLVAPPVLVLGALSPWAIRLRVRTVAGAGDVTAGCTRCPPPAGWSATSPPRSR